MSARNALEIGLINTVVPDALAESQEVAARLAKGPATAIGSSSERINQSHELPLERVLEMEANYQTIAARQPDFRGEVASARKARRQAAFT